MLAVHPEDANHLFASSDDTIWETAGAGDPWTALGNPIPAQVTGITFVGSPPRLYVLSDGAGLFTLDAAGTVARHRRPRGPGASAEAAMKSRGRLGVGLST